MFIRVEFFTSSGKWYTTEQIDWSAETAVGPLHHDIAAFHLRAHFAKGGTPDRLRGMIAVIFDVPDYCPIMGVWNGEKFQDVRR